jgi:hypothetical protein
MTDARHPLAPSFERFCECLNDFEVDYLVVGSEAAASYVCKYFLQDVVSLLQERVREWHQIGAIPPVGAVSSGLARRT